MAYQCAVLCGQKRVAETSGQKRVDSQHEAAVDGSIFFKKGGVSYEYHYDYQCFHDQIWDAPAL